MSASGIIVKYAVVSLLSKDLPRLLLPPGQVLKIQQNPLQDVDTEQEPLQPSCTTTK